MTWFMIQHLAHASSSVKKISKDLGVNSNLAKKNFVHVKEHYIHAYAPFLEGYYTQAHTPLHTNTQRFRVL